MSKKLNLLSVAVVAALALPMAANAGAAKVYGQVHVALQQTTMGSDDAKWDIDGTSSKANKLGVKGSVDTNLMDFKAVYQYEAGLNMEVTDTFDEPDKVDPTNDVDTKVGEGIYFQRDTWVGLSSKSMGTVRAGTIGTAWKSTSKMVDPLFTTALESRSGAGGIGGASKALAGGKGVYAGRATSTVRYDSPMIAGAKVSANYGFVDGSKNPMGLGVLYKMGDIAAFFNYQSTEEDLSAMKVGAKMKMGAIGVSGAYEIDGGAISKKKDGKMNMFTGSASYSMGATTLIAKYSMNADSETGTNGADKLDQRSGFALAVSQKVAKKASIYAGYGSSSGELSKNDVKALAIGMKAGF